MVVPADDDGARSLISGTKVDMGRTLDDDPKMAALVDATLDKMGPTVDSHDHGSPAVADLTRVEKPKGDWVGADSCRACHEKQFEDWRTTPHARAYVTLLKEKRQYDQDCWSCHVTGAGMPGGPQTPKEVGHLRNVQCESCHGAGRKHIEDPRTDMVKDPGEAHCKTCHSDEQTEGRFEYSEYLPKVQHR